MNLNNNLNNNMNNQQSPIINNLDNSIHSSDIDETIDEKKEKDSNLSMMPNAQMFQITNSNLPIQNIIPNNDNIYNNIRDINHKKKFFTQKNLEVLKNKLSTKISQNSRKQNGHNIQIPIEFISNYHNNNTNTNTYGSIEEFNKLNNFIRISNTPTLCLDLTNKSYELELKLSKLKNQLNEKLEKIKQLENQKLENEKVLNDHKLYLTKKRMNR